LYIALKLRGVRFEYIPEHTCCYRFHGQNLTAPASVLSEKVQKSRTRYKRKIISIPGFDNLSIETRYIFFLDYLTHILRGDYRKQKEVIDSSQFTRLPKRKQSQLIYYMCVENLLCDVRWEDQVSHLFTAMKINPQNLKLYWLLLISLLIPSWRRRIILWRRGLQKDEAVDPITYILEHKAEPS
ncbi:MAG: hypothetical protein RBT75_21245, partial [Anaerolineae bacterium]|nr:hypothetical protein [Anaerolineae bacterium]